MVEPQIVVLDVAGSSPVDHPIFFSFLHSLILWVAPSRWFLGSSFLRWVYEQPKATYQRIEFRPGGAKVGRHHRGRADVLDCWAGAVVVEKHNWLAMNKKLWCLSLLFLLPALSSCRPPVGPARFSRVSEGGFSPESGFAARGYVLKSSSNTGTANPVTMIRCHSWQGVVTVPGTTNGCEAVAVAIRDALNQSLGGWCQDELVQMMQLNFFGKAGQLFYHKDGMQGEVRVWLFGTPSESEVRYVVYLREEKAEPDSFQSAAPRWQFWRRNWKMS